MKLAVLTAYRLLPTAYCLLLAIHAASGLAWRSFSATQFSMRSMACCSARCDEGIGFFSKNARTSRARSAEQKPPSDPTIAGIPWNSPRFFTIVCQFVCTNSHVISWLHGCTIMYPISVPVSCVRTAGEIAYSSVRLVSAGSVNQESAFKNR